MKNNGKLQDNNQSCSMKRPGGGGRKNEWNEQIEQTITKRSAHFVHLHINKESKET
jgi:hypothetical protein